MKLETKQPFLSICIPTYNQPEELRRLLESFLPQIHDLRLVDIVVRDDSSDDRTEEIVKVFSKNFPIRYFKGKKEGLDAAILFLTEEARGKYVWWLGDDLIAPGGLITVLNLIARHPSLNFIFMNSLDLNSGIPAYFRREGFFRNANAVLEEMADGLGFISATIFEREKALPALPAARRCIGTAWVNLYLVLTVLRESQSFYFVSTPYIQSFPKPPNQSHWYDSFTIFAINIYSVVMMFDKSFSRRSIRKMLSNILWRICKGIFVFRALGYTASGLGSRKAKIPILFRFYWSYAIFWSMLPILLLPRWVDRILYNFYLKIRR